MTNDKGKRLAMLLDSIEKAKREFADERQDFNKRLKTLQTEVRMLSHEIVTGQQNIFDRPKKDKAKSATATS